MIKKLFLISVSCFLLVAPFQALAQAEKIEIKFATAAADNLDEPYTFTIYEFKKALEEELPGHFDVKIFPNRQLGDEKEILEGLSFGTVDMGVNTNAIMANVEPAFQLNDLPFLYANDQQAYDVLDGEVGQMLSDKMASHGIITLGYASGGYRNMINNVRPIIAPDDVDGIKFRVMPSPLFLGMFKALNGNAIPMPWGESYTAMQQGTVDGMEIPIPVIYTYKFAEITKYLSLTNHTFNVIGVNIAKDFYEKLSGEEQTAIKNAVRKAVVIERATFEKNVQDYIGKLQDAGMQVDKIDSPQAFRDRMEELYTEFRPVIGAEIFDAAMKAVK